MYDASDRKEVRRAEKAAKLAERNRGEVLKQIASTIPGRQYLYNQLAIAHVFDTPYSDNTNHTYFNLGEQNFGLRLLAEIMQFCPDEFLEMIREANGRRTESESSPGYNRTNGERSNDEEPGRVDQGYTDDIGTEAGFDEAT